MTLSLGWVLSISQEGLSPKLREGRVQCTVSRVVYHRPPDRTSNIIGTCELHLTICTY